MNYSTFTNSQLRVLVRQINQELTKRIMLDKRICEIYIEPRTCRRLKGGCAKRCVHYRT